MSKDWTGGSASTFVTIGATNHTDKEREINDYYATDPIAIDVLKNIGVKLPRKIWEPCCGSGHLSKRLEDYGHEVISTDLIDRGYGVGGCDFLKAKRMPVDCHCILTNPPYKYAQEMIEHGLEIMEDGDEMWMFLKLSFLESKGRRKLFDSKQLAALYVSSNRILCAKNGDFEYMKATGGSAVAYGWYKFVKGWNKDPIIKWIN